MLNRLSVLIMFALSGCATLANDEVQRIPVEAEKGSYVEVNGAKHEAPTVLEFPRGKGDQELTIVKNGKPQKMTLKETADTHMYYSAYWPGIGLIFIAIDAITGKGYALEPGKIAF